jgi:peptidoglycan-associated lipoprotein
LCYYLAAICAAINKQKKGGSPKQEKPMFLRASKLGLCGILCLALLGLSVSGCKSKKDDMLLPDDGSSSMENTSGDGLPNVDTSRLKFERAYDLKVVYFDYDSSSLRADAMAALRDNAAVMKSKPEMYFQVEGHCDERGTQEYNLALGERRALAVRQHLIQLGVSGDRLLTISYGEEFPAEMGGSESAWAKNRRAEFGQAVMQ